MTDVAKDMILCSFAKGFDKNDFDYQVLRRYFNWFTQ